MNVKELRIGNWMKSVHPLTGRESDTTVFNISMQTACDRLGYIITSPIKITEEWLVKFRFYREVRELETFYKRLHFEYATSSKTIDVVLEGLEESVSYVTNIKYVHELQNLFFAFTGGELNENNNETD